MEDRGKIHIDYKCTEYITTLWARAETLNVKASVTQHCWT